MVVKRILDPSCDTCGCGGPCACPGVNGYILDVTKANGSVESINIPKPTDGKCYVQINTFEKIREGVEQCCGTYYDKHNTYHKQTNRLLRSQVSGRRWQYYAKWEIWKVKQIYLAFSSYANFAIITFKEGYQARHANWGTPGGGPSAGNGGVTYGFSLKQSESRLAGIQGCGLIDGNSYGVPEASFPIFTAPELYAISSHSTSPLMVDMAVPACGNPAFCCVVYTELNGIDPGCPERTFPDPLRQHSSYCYKELVLRTNNMCVFDMPSEVNSPGTSCINYPMHFHPYIRYQVPINGPYGFYGEYDVMVVCDFEYDVGDPGDEETLPVSMVATAY